MREERREGGEQSLLHEETVGKEAEKKKQNRGGRAVEWCAVARAVFLSHAPRHIGREPKGT